MAMISQHEQKKEAELSASFSYLPQRDGKPKGF
jgi:hypothetical protein